MRKYDFNKVAKSGKKSNQKWRSNSVLNIPNENVGNLVEK